MIKRGNEMLKGRKFPDTLVIIFTLMIIFLILTWIIPSGEFERTDHKGREIIVPGSYEKVEPNPQFLELFTAPIKGFNAASDIIAFVLIVGGVFSIINMTGAINAFLFSIINLTQKKPALKRFIIPIIMIFFSLGGATFGMSEETLVFVMITIPLAISLKYDPIVGVSMAFVGAGLGFAGAFLNPFTIGIAQGIADIPLFSGQGYRFIVWAVFTLIGISYISIYAGRIERNPEKSLTGKIEYKGSLKGVDKEDMEFTKKRKIVLILLGLSLIILILGVQSKAIIPGLSGWYIEEISALFLALGILSGIICRFSPGKIVEAFSNGAKDMAIPALIIGFARSILIIAEDGRIIDTILYYATAIGDGLPAFLSVQIMFLLQTCINFFIPSGSGQAALTMPLMAPLSDVLGFSRQTAVLAYQMGDGITNLIVPTSAILMGILQIAKIPYDKWFRFILPLIIILSITAMLFLIIPGTIFTWN